MGPTGSSGTWVDCAHRHETTNSVTASIAKYLCLDMDSHLIDGVVEIAAGIPDRRERLCASLAIRRAGCECKVARVWSLPLQIPQPPRIARVIGSQLRILPGSAGISRDFDTNDVGVSRPCDS